MSSCYFSSVTEEIFQLINQYGYKFVGEVLTNMISTKEMIRREAVGIPNGMKKCNLFLLPSMLEF